MNRFDLLTISVRNLWRRKTRSLLTVLGVVIGTSSIVVMISLGLALDAGFQEQLQQMGDLNIISVSEDGNQQGAEKEAETQAEFRNLDDLAIKIAEYEMYYRDPHMVSKEEATFQSLYDTLEKYVLIYHLEQAGYDWDEAKRQLHEKTTREAVEYDINHPILKDYFEQMFATLGITKDDYLKQYALIEKYYSFRNETEKWRLL